MNKRPFLRRCPGARTIPGLVAGGGAGRGGPSCQGDPGGRGEVGSDSAPARGAGGRGATMSGRKRSFTFGAYGG